MALQKKTPFLAEGCFLLVCYYVVMTIEAIASTIKAAARDRSPILIAIEGYGGSGKTTAAKALANQLGDTFIVHMDDFVVKEKFTENSWDEAFDRKRLEKQILEPMSAQTTAAYQTLIWESNLLSDYITVPKTKCLIVEGISSYHPDISKYYDYKIWIDTPITIAKERGRARDSNNENVIHWDLWAENDIRYQQEFHPEQAADFIYSNKPDVMY